MELQAVTRTLNLGEHVQGLRPGWDESQQDRPEEEIPFLDPDFLSWSCRETYLPADLTALVLSAADCIRGNAALCALAWHCHHRLFGASATSAEIRRWPVPRQAMGPLSGFFYAVVLLSGTPQRIRIHTRRHIPADVVKETVYDLELCIRTEPPDALHGQAGIAPTILGWLMTEWRGHLYRLGRLQYGPDTFFGKLRAYRHRRTRAVVALSEGGLRFRADGRFDGAAGIVDEHGAWETRLAVGPDAVTGYPVSPVGLVVNRAVRLPFDEWEPALEPGDPILAIHMPAGPPMAFDQCGDSLRRALTFFPEHFPDRPFRALASGSWLLDSQFPDLLPDSSNLVRFQKEMYLFPRPGGSGAMPRQVRLAVDPDPEQDPPPMTTMQRAFYDHVAKGGRFYAGGCFLFPEDLDWGRQVYRRQPPIWE